MRAATVALQTTATVAALVTASNGLVCDSLQDNTLTSEGCPAKCGTNPCVLYSPSQKQCLATGASGECFTDESFKVSGTNDTCSVVYQCLDRIMDKNKFLLSLVPSSQQDHVTTASVTKIQQLTYPTYGIYTVQVAGGHGTTARGEVKELKLDGSLFSTPQSVKSFYISDINLRNALTTVDFGKRSWSSVALNNANLTEVPAELAKLELQYLELSKNFISKIPDAMPFQNLSTLKLDFNNLTDLSIELPAVVSLNLTGNPLAKIPNSIFSIRTLQMLSLRQCNLTNVVLTDAQFAFLQHIRTLDTDMMAPSCPRGTVARELHGGVATVCIPVDPPTGFPSGDEYSPRLDVSLIQILCIAAGVTALTGLLVRSSHRCRTTNSSRFNDFTNDTWASKTMLNHEKVSN